MRKGKLTDKLIDSLGLSVGGVKFCRGPNAGQESDCHRSRIAEFDGFAEGRLQAWIEG